MDAGTLTFDAAGEAGVLFDVFRDGERVATGLAGPSWTDPEPAPPTATRCYAVASVFTATGHSSQHTPPQCDWGPGYARISTFPAASLLAVGGTFVLNHGREHYEGWGAPDHTLEVSAFTAQSAGLHYVQAVYGNGAGPVSTGITCANKRVDVYEGGTWRGGGLLVMPQLGSWEVWEDSTLVPMTLEAGHTYRIVVSDAQNMSILEHFAGYSGTGGAAGPFNDVNIAEIKILAME